MPPDGGSWRTIIVALQSILKLFVGDKHARERKRLWPIVEEINALAEDLADLSDAELQGNRAPRGEDRGDGDRRGEDPRGRAAAVSERASGQGRAPGHGERLPGKA